ERLALLASGVFVRATAPRASCTPGSAVPVDIEVVLRRPSSLQFVRAVFPDGQSKALDAPLGTHEKKKLSAAVQCAADAQPSMPSWLSEPSAPGHAVLRDPSALDDAAGPPPLMAAIELKLDGRTLTLPAPVVHAFTDRVQGERERNVLVVPPLTVTP